MRINQNISALNAWRNLTATDAALNKSLERLSSGFRVNRAADDAAGLAISEKMRAQIKGLNQAVRNAQDGISMIQTAEGALTETHSILQRMRELAVQASNDTLTDADRAEIQKEVDQLIAELDRIGNNTEFNTKKLVNGETGAKITVAADTKAKNFAATSETTTGSYTINSLTAAGKATASSSDGSTVDLVATTALGAASSIAINNYTFNFTATDTIQTVVDTINASKDKTGVEVSFDATNDKLDFSSVGIGSASKITFGATTGVFDDATATNILKVADNTTSSGSDAQANVSGYTGDYVASGNKIEFVKGVLKGLAFEVTATDATPRALTIDKSGMVSFQVGANASQTIGLSIADMRATALGVNSVKVDTKTNANSAITSVESAISSVSTERAKLGAVQNRLEHTITNLGVSAENLTAAESRIRDVDMALEMAAFTRSQILLQAGTAMMAQANMKPQAVLQLLG